MKRSHSMFIILILFLILFSIYFVKIQFQLNSPETTLLKSFSSSGAKIVSAEIYFWGRIDNEKYDSLDELKKLAVDFSKELGVDESNMLSSKSVNNDLIQEVEINGTIGKNRLVNISAHSGKSKSALNERFISVSIIEDLSSTGLEEARKEVLAVFKKYKIKPKINSCITGHFDGRLNYTQMNDICKRIFKEAGARKVEGMRDGNFISISAYSPVIGNFIRVEENKVNLNLALRYNSYEDKTYIWLATPVITTEY